MMRVSFVRQCTLDAFSAGILRLVRDFAASDVQFLKNIDLYLTPMAGGTVRVFRGPDGRPIDHLQFDPDEGKPCHYVRGVPSPLASQAERLAHADWRGGDLGYLQSKWQLSLLELATLMAGPPERVNTLLASPASTFTPEERLRLTILLQINSCLVDFLHGQSVGVWLRHGATMSAFAGDSPLAQLTTFGFDAMDRMRRALARYAAAVGKLELDDLSDGYDWVLDDYHGDWDNEK